MSQNINNNSQQNIQSQTNNSVSKLKKIPLSFLGKVSEMNIAYSSIFYYGSIFFMFSTSFNHALHVYSTKKRKQKLIKLLTDLKEEFSLKNNSKSSLEIIYYIYFKCLNEIYNKEREIFKEQRRLYLKDKKSYLSFINHCLQCFKEENEFEEEIFDNMSTIFELNFDAIQIMFDKEELDLRKIKGKYFSNRTDIEIPISLEGRKLDEVIKFLHRKYLEFIDYIQNSGLQIREDKILLIAELFAFDSTYFEYNVEYEAIEKCLYQNNLNIVEYNI